MSLLKEGVEIGARGTIVVEESEMTYIHPCVSEAGMVATETRLTSGPKEAADLKVGFIDPIIICWAFTASGLFNDSKCSQNLSIAKVQVDDRTVLVFKDRGINVRRAKNKQDAIETIR